MMGALHVSELEFGEVAGSAFSLAWVVRLSIQRVDDLLFEFHSSWIIVYGLVWIYFALQVAVQGRVLARAGEGAWDV